MELRFKCRFENIPNELSLIMYEIQLDIILLEGYNSL